MVVTLLRMVKKCYGGNIVKMYLTTKTMNKIINWLKMEWAVFQYTDSVEATNGNSPQWEVDQKIKEIKRTFIPNKGASRTESPDSDLIINSNGRTKRKFDHT
jgi:hypothetical protein